MLIVDNDLIMKATECQHDHECQKKDFNSIMCMNSCEVENTVQELLFVKEKLRNYYCSYKIPFGYSFYCKCPVRNEIYRKYQI